MLKAEMEERIAELEDVLISIATELEQDTPNLDELRGLVQDVLGEE